MGIQTIANTNNAFSAPNISFYSPNAGAILEVQNGDTVTLPPGTLVAILTTAAVTTGPVQVNRSSTSASNLNLGVVVGQTIAVGKAGTILTEGFCLVNNGTASGTTAGHFLVADTSVRGAVTDGGTTVATTGTAVGIALSTTAVSLPVLAYIHKM
jgi:hypothetical protein